MSWVVVMMTEGRDKPVVWGPLEGGLAAAFAEFLTAEVDPAVAVPLVDPAAELLGWREHIAGPAFARLAEVQKLATDWVCSPDGAARERGRDLDDVLRRPYPGEPS